MKIPPNAIEKFLQTININKTKSVLIYGPDTGLVSIRAKLLKNKFIKNEDNYSFTEFEYEKIKDCPRNLIDELNSYSFFSSFKFVILRVNSTSSLSPDFIKFLSEKNWNNFLLIIASDIGPSSNYRKLYEAEEDLAAIACYKDEETDIKSIIKHNLAKDNFIIDDDCLNLITSNISGDRMLILNEIDKIKLYFANNKKISFDELELLIGDSKEIEQDNIAHLIAAKNLPKSLKEIDRFFQEGNFFIVAVRSLIRYFSMIYNVKYEISKGINEIEATSNIKPPIFFKHKPVFSQNLKKWNLKELAQILSSLHNLETDCKKSGSNPKQLLENFVLDNLK